jgi:MFS superfamily sulfate permease-like transporter
MAIFAIFVLIGFALSWYFQSWLVFNNVIGYFVIFASIPLGLKFASVAGLNPIAVFFTYIVVFWIVYFFIFLSKR